MCNTLLDDTIKTAEVTYYDKTYSREIKWVVKTILYYSGHKQNVCMVKCLEHHRITFSFLIIRALLVFFLLLESNDLRSALPRFRSESNDLRQNDL